MRQLLAAMSGWGKSYHAQAVAERNISKFDRSLILDYKDEYRGLVVEGDASALIVGEEEAHGYGVRTWRKLLEVNPDLVVIRAGITESEWRAACSRAVKAVREMQGSAYLLVDEAHFVAPQRGEVPDPIKGLATTGRGERVASTWVTQRLTELEETVLAQTTEMLAGGFTSDRDRSKLDPEYPQALHNPEADRVPNLPDDLKADDEPYTYNGQIPLRRFEDDDGNTVGSEWAYSDDRGNRERLDTRNLSMTATHYGAQGETIERPDYG